MVKPAAESQPPPLAVDAERVVQKLNGLIRAPEHGPPAADLEAEAAAPPPRLFGVELE